MGITGLLPFLEPAKRPCHISEFRGATVAIDTYCWLHKGATLCPIQLVQGEDTREHIDYCLRYVKMLQIFDIRPILVFDGKNLPAKAKTESKRRESRIKAKQRGAELLRLGKTQEARSYLKQAVNISPEIASALIKECHKINVDCIVAPYESDAQLAFFNLKGIAEVIITEDSDLVLFGCTKVLYKLDSQGNGILVEAEKIPQAMKLRPDRYTFDKFRYMCILSGCDYVDSLHGIGLQKAKKFITMTEETNPEIFLFRIPRYLKMSQLQVTEEYKENFMMAEATFRHQIVFDPFKKKLVPLTDPEECGSNPKYCFNAGEMYDNEKAFQVAIGNLHPSTFERLDNWYPHEQTNSSSIWSGCYKKTISRKQHKLETKATLTQTKNSKLSFETNDTELRIQQDEQIKKELEFYSHIPIGQNPLETSRNVDDEEEEEKAEAEENKPDIVSPVLKMNPFIRKPKIRSSDEQKTDTPDQQKQNSSIVDEKQISAKMNLFKKKLSKFPRTAIETNSIVKSRYFASQSTNFLVAEGSESFKNETEELGATQKTDSLESVPNSSIVTTTAIVHTNETIISSINENESVEAKNEKQDFNVNHEKKIDNEMNSISFTKIGLDNEIIVIEEDSSVSKSPRKSITDVNTIAKTVKKSLLSPKSSPSVKRKLGMCRMVSTKKPRSQPHITAFFKKP